MEIFISGGFLINAMLWIMLISMAIAVVARKDLLSAAVHLAIYSLVTAAIFLFLDAPDVAITEAAIGSAISFLFLLATFRIVGKTEPHEKNYTIVAGVICVLMFGIFCLIMGDMPEFGSISSPANAYLGRYYVNNTVSETGIPNAVTAVLASYRGFDTLGETYVVICAALAVLLILPASKKLEDKQ